MKKGRKKFVITMYDPKVIEVLLKLERKKWVFIEAAVEHFLKTEEGILLLNNLLSEEEEDWEEVNEWGKGKGVKGKGGKGRINFDDFF